MKQKGKLICPVCSNKFIPRTFYPEEAIFSTSDGKKLSGFNGYMSSNGVKPAEVILGSWITYCPNCNYVMKFVKEIVKKEKIQTAPVPSKDIKEKYNNYYFGFPFEDYNQYLAGVANKVNEVIEVSLKDLNLSGWEKMYDIEDTFKTLVRFYVNLENYCDSLLPANKEKELSEKIKLLNLSSNLETSLIELDKVRNDTVHGIYELTYGDKERVKTAVLDFTLNLIEKHIRPIVDPKILKNKFIYADLKDLYSEVKVFLNTYLNSIFSNGKSANKQIRAFLDHLFTN